jgi:hypothetical protein
VPSSGSTARAAQLNRSGWSGRVVDKVAKPKRRAAQLNS